VGDDALAKETRLHVYDMRGVSPRRMASRPTRTWAGHQPFQERFRAQYVEYIRGTGNLVFLRVLDACSKRALLPCVQSPPAPQADAAPEFGSVTLRLGVKHYIESAALRCHLSARGAKKLSSTNGGQGRSSLEHAMPCPAPQE